MSVSMLFRAVLPHRLSELIVLAEAGLYAEEAEDDTGRLSELFRLAETSLHA